VAEPTAEIVLDGHKLELFEIIPKHSYIVKMPSDDMDIGDRDAIIEMFKGVTKKIKVNFILVPNYLEFTEATAYEKLLGDLETISDDLKAKLEEIRNG